jgi:hypothetical protein
LLVQQQGRDLALDHGIERCLERILEVLAGEGASEM